MIDKLVSAAKKILEEKDGPTAVEYAIMFAIIIVVCIVAVKALSSQSSTTFSNGDGQIAGS